MQTRILMSFLAKAKSLPCPFVWPLPTALQRRLNPQKTDSIFSERNTHTKVHKSLPETKAVEEQSYFV